ncbi:MAG: adenylosuccinate lyase [Candidatus Theseobacter exili]|nr:adenylosuccinate lyase [Candidatus Theseobacter exili]
MIERYTTPEMKELWSEHNKYKTWMDVEILACEGLTTIGEIPADDLHIIKSKADFEIDRILEIEKTTDHDVIAFLTCMAEYIGPSSRYVHLGLTSSDVLDTSMSFLMKNAIKLIIKEMSLLTDAVKEKAVKYKQTVMIGRSHGVHAEPVTFGLKMCLFYDEMKRNLKRLEDAERTISYGKISGAVGTHANIDPRVEEYVCEKLGLLPAPVSTQILQRDRHAQYLTSIAVVGSSIAKYAEEFRNLQRTEILEVEEQFKKGQKGSSAMPHKKNPITSERICGIARILRGNALVAMENISLWHERDITHSSAERVIVPDSTTLLHYIIRKMNTVVRNLKIYSDNMLKNLNSTGGLIFSQRILLELAKKGITREASYKLVQRNAMKTWESKNSFKDMLLEDNEIMDILGKDKIEECFDLNYHLRNIDHIYSRLDL